MSTETENSILSVGQETPCVRAPDCQAVVKEEYDVTAEDGTTETGNSANSIATEVDQTGGINPERCDVNSSEHPLPAECIWFAENNVQIKKEEDAFSGDEVSQAIETECAHSPKDEESSECVNATNEPTASHNVANRSSIWGFCEENRPGATSTVVEDTPICESQRVPSHSDGFQLEPTMKDLGYHSVFHVEAKQFPCTYCPSEFMSKRDLKSHLKIHTNGKSFPCTFCSAKFRHLSLLKRHLTTHTGEKSFSCKKCPAKFSAKGCLDRHLIFHTGERPFLCTICHAKFALKSTLKRHMTNHTR